MSISSRQLLSRLKSTRLFCPHRKYDNMRVERITGRIPSTLPSVGQEPVDAYISNQNAAKYKSEFVRFHTVSDWQSSFLNGSMILTSDFGDFDRVQYCEHQNKTSIVLNDYEPCVFHGKSSVARRLQNMKKYSHQFDTIKSSRKQYSQSQSTEGPPADDHKQKIRRLELKLRSEVPKFLEPGKLQHDFNIYASNIELVISRSTECRVCSGLSAYKGMMYLYRSICKFWLRQPRLDVLSITCHEDKKVIDIRWRITGRPYYSQLFSFLFPPRRLNRHYDFISVLSVNEDGRICRHLITKLRPVRSHLMSHLSGVKKRLDSTVMGPLTSRQARCGSSDGISDS